MGAGAGCRARVGHWNSTSGLLPPRWKSMSGSSSAWKGRETGQGQADSAVTQQMSPSLLSRPSPGGCTLFPVPTHLPLFSGRRGRGGEGRQVQRQTHRQAGRKQVCRVGARRRESPASGQNARLERTSVRKTEKDAQREHSGEQVMYSLSTPPAPHTQKPFAGRAEAMRLFYPDGCTPQGLLS